MNMLDTSICCTRGAATTPIVIAKFKRLEHAVEVANEESKETHALTKATLERERVAKQKAERAKAARMIFDEKSKEVDNNSSSILGHVSSIAYLVY